ncbi:MAG: branched-chain amino acid ABC transporter permease [Actinomycetota bacterium]|nr:branched-chain amino acid ABC transporter permease [Acidimicrobiia bacterium]MDQ3145437.1 branched-chain amino acid ABC transporter permease [Actinomycetota bacterium]
MNWELIFESGLTAAFGQNAVIYALAAIGLNLHFGYTGLLNFGQVAFVAAGAYGLAISVATFELPFPVGVVIGILSAVVLALLLGIPTLRLRADYLAIVTIAAGEIIRFILKSPEFDPTTGGSNGLQNFAGGFFDLNPFSPGEYGVWVIKYNERLTWVLVVGWSLVALCSLLVLLLMRSPWGRVLKAIREDEEAVRSLGKNVYWYKMQSLILGGVFGALGGLVFAVVNQSVQPDNYSTAFTFFAYTALLLGGAARVAGPVLGAMIFWFLLQLTDVALREAISADYIPSTILEGPDVGQVRLVLVGLGLMLLMIFRPQGFFGDKREVAVSARR